MITTTTRSSMMVKPRLSDMPPPALGPFAPVNWRAAAPPRPPGYSLPSLRGTSPNYGQMMIPSTPLVAPAPTCTVHSVIPVLMVGLLKVIV